MSVSASTHARIVALLDQRRTELETLRESVARSLGDVVCPACGSFVPALPGALSEHARMYSDRQHLAVEIMES